MTGIDQVIKNFDIAKSHTCRIVMPSLMVSIFGVLSESCGGAFYPYHPTKYRKTTLMLPTENYSVLVARENGDCVIYYENGR